MADLAYDYVSTFQIGKFLAIYLIIDEMGVAVFLNKVISA
jgi:hypothetical protein